MDNKGYVTTEHTVWCVGITDATCPNWDQVSGRLKHCEEIWRKLGWKKTRKYGWICPDCQKRRL